MATHIAWGSIELLHNIIRTFDYKGRNGIPLPKITYRAKVKLHGSNCAVQIHPEGVFCQSRTSMLTPESDYKGFAKWVMVYEGYFRSLTSGDGSPLTVFGEWAGPGVESGMAVSMLDTKVFAVFAIQVGSGDSAKVVSDPTEIAALLGVVPVNMFVLPWHGDTLDVDFGDRASLEAVAVEANRRIEAVEKEDPWVKETFGISGLGEGIVFYPVVVEGGSVPTDPENLLSFMWKAKGEKHRTAGTKVAVQVDASVVANTAEFVALMVTEARLEQGLTIVCGGTKDVKLTGKFIAWATADVKKESEAELAASNLTWTQVEKAVSTRAREWFLAR